MKSFRLYLWQLPQNLVGIVVKLVTRAKNVGTGYCIWEYGSGLSLGNYVFVSKYAGSYTRKHEHGHQIQSLYLGWLYLIVIGLPSLVWCILYTALWRDKYYYYSFYTEAWANHLVGQD